MKQITLIIVVALFCMSASVVSKNVFTPAKPKYFFIKDFNDKKQAVLEAKKLHGSGWQNITIQMSQSGDAIIMSMIVTAEKY